jgi:hypothetical protein
MRSFQLSVFLHLLFIGGGLFFSGGVWHEGPGGPSSTPSEGGPRGQKEKFGELLPPPIDVMKVTPEVDAAIKKQDKGIRVEKQREAEKKCPRSYGGIGIVHDWGQVITEIYPGYPASRSGLQIGDRILNSEEIRGDVGTEIIVRVVRERDMMMTFKMIREKICAAE